MAQVINTNVPSLNAQRNLNSSQNLLATSLERLSTGLRINSAKDDAAGLAISERFTSQIRGLDQAVRNANDGISFAQTAEGALGTIGDALQRIRELSVQAANDSNSASDRQALNNEVEQLVDEVNRIALNTEFNGGRVLDGTQSDIFFQVGANQGQTIAVSGVDSRATELGAMVSVSATGLTQDQINVDELTAITDVVITPAGEGALTTAITASMTGVVTVEDAVRAINDEISTRIAAGDADAELIADSGYQAAVRVDNAGLTSISISSARGDDTNLFVVTGGAATTGNAVPVVVELAADTAAVTDLTAISVATREEAFESIQVATEALTQVSNLRAELGAVQTRFESSIANLSITSENLSAARSRILDADFAQETANLTRASILQQAGTAMLAQANALPQNVLSLLG
jgi:flagellin